MTHGCSLRRCLRRQHSCLVYQQLSLLLALALVCLPVPAAGQWDHPPESGGRTRSLGQPKKIHWQAGFAAGPVLDRTRDELAVRGHFGFTRDLMNPVAGLAGLSLEAYFGARASAAEGGGRVLLPVPYFGVGAGADYNLRDRELALLVSAYSPLRRGGIIVPGGLARVDWYPTRKHSLTLGVSLPVRDPLAGRGRPIRDHITVGAGHQQGVRYHMHDAEVEAALDSLSVSAEWIRRLVAPFLDQDGRNAQIAARRTERYLVALAERLRGGTVEQEVRQFHRLLERAFTITAGSDAVGARLARTARSVLLDEVILPYNRLLGRKKRNDTLHDLSTAAQGNFSRWVVGSGILPAERTDQVLFVFQELTLVLNDVRRAAAVEWDDARLVWLPLQYALLPEDHDEKAELDALLERATGVRFLPSHVQYASNVQFQAELIRSIQETRNYHVLWIHDFAAVTARADYDWASLQVAVAYLTTLAERLEAYDSTASLPSFFIFIDQHYYEERKSRLLMSVLEDPLRRNIAAASTDENIGLLTAAQERLRTAVRASRVLNVEARHYGEGWLRNRVKVHVNVTNRPDPSFWSGSLIATVFGYPDNVMRDHRKIVFRDVEDADSANGVAIITGTGVGQNYLVPSWEDRMLIVRGPVTKELKRAARDLLLSQGMRERHLPLAFRSAAAAAGPRPYAVGEDLETAAMVLVNGTGYLDKPLNVGKAVLYSLLASGDVIKIPDSLWNSTFFGGLLVGACLRGGRVSIVAPATENAPSGGFPQMSRAHELLSALLLARQVLADAMASAGGELSVGIYALGADQSQFAARSARWAERLASEPPLLRLMPFSASAAAAIRTAPEAGAFLKAADATASEPPKLHMKVQFFATRELWDAVANAAAWPEFISSYLEYRSGPPGGEEQAGLRSQELTRLARGIFEAAGRQTQAGAYAMVGSQNQDYRGMFMDGEVGVLFAGHAALVPLLDLALVEGIATWVDSREMLDRLIPPAGEMKRRLARVAKDAL